MVGLFMLFMRVFWYIKQNKILNCMYVLFIYREKGKILKNSNIITLLTTYFLEECTTWVREDKKKKLIVFWRRSYCSSIPSYSTQKVEITGDYWPNDKFIIILFWVILNIFSIYGTIFFTRCFLRKTHRWLINPTWVRPMVVNHGYHLVAYSS